MTPAVYEHRGERRRVLSQGPEGVTYYLPDAPHEPPRTVSRGAWLEWTSPELRLDFNGRPIRGQRAAPRSHMSQALLFGQVGRSG